MKAYRMYHIPTGLYFCPSREIQVNSAKEDGTTVKRYVKSNLSKKGKIYHSRPTFKFIGNCFYSHLGNFQFNYTSRTKNQLVPFIETEWEIQEI